VQSIGSPTTLPQQLTSVRAPSREVKAAVDAFIYAIYHTRQPRAFIFPAFMLLGAGLWVGQCQLSGWTWWSKFVLGPVLFVASCSMANHIRRTKNDADDQRYAQTKATFERDFPMGSPQRAEAVLVIQDLLANSPVWRSQADSAGMWDGDASIRMVHFGTDEVLSNELYGELVGGAPLQKIRAGRCYALLISQSHAPLDRLTGSRLLESLGIMLRAVDPTVVTEAAKVLIRLSWEEGPARQVLVKLRDQLRRSIR